MVGPAQQAQRSLGTKGPCLPHDSGEAPHLGESRAKTGQEKALNDQVSSDEQQVVTGARVPGSYTTNLLSEKGAGLGEAPLTREPGPSAARRGATLVHPSSPACPHYQTSVTPDTGVWLTISGATNSGVPYRQYWGSPGVSSWAFPKSQILTCSSPSAPSQTIRFSGCGAQGRAWELSQGGRMQHHLSPTRAPAPLAPAAPHLDIQVQHVVLVQVAYSL